MIPIKSPAEFSRLLKALADDVVYAHIHWRMASDLEASLKEHPLVAAQSNTFWYLARRAHITASIQHLCRAYDQEQASLHLLSWLKTIKSNLALFDTEKFRERLKDNPYVNSLADAAEKPDPNALEADINSCMTTEPLVKKLVTYRSNQVAHKSARLVRQLNTEATATAISDSEFETLLLRAKTILNRYSYLFAAEHHSTSIIGREDYKHIFTSVEANILRSRDHDGG